MFNLVLLLSVLEPLCVRASGGIVEHSKCTRCYSHHCKFQVPVLYAPTFIA